MTSPSSRCIVCETVPKEIRLRFAGLGKYSAKAKYTVAGYSITENAARTHREHELLGIESIVDGVPVSAATGALVTAAPLREPGPAKAPPGFERGIEWDGKKGWLSSGPFDGEIVIKDWQDLLVFAGFDPEFFDIETQNVQFRMWQGMTSKDRGNELVWQRYYKVPIKKREGDLEKLIQEDLDAASERLRKWKPQPLIRRTLGIGLGIPVTYVHAQGDEQGGKSEGGGLDGLAQRELDTLERSLTHLNGQKKKGANIEGIGLPRTGDKIENIFGHYNSQQRTTDTLRMQWKYALQSEETLITAFAEHDLPMHMIYTPSNHGDIRQSIGQAPFTSASDNYDLILAECYQTMLKWAPFADQLNWHIPHDEWMTLVELSGVLTGTAHGHHAKGDITKWANDQVSYWLRHHQKRLGIIFTGHHHTGKIVDINGATHIQSASQDGGSPYFEAMTGKRSFNGAVGLLVGKHTPFGWSDVSWI